MRTGLCLVGGVNWPLCALGIEVHPACLDHRMHPKPDGSPTEGGDR